MYLRTTTHKHDENSLEEGPIVIELNAPEQVDELGGEGVQLEDGLLAGHGDVILVPTIKLLNSQHIPKVD